MKDVSANTEPNDSSRIDLIGFMMVITPLISSIILWYWFYHINSMNVTNRYIIVIIFSTVLLTSIFASIDSHRLGTGKVLFQFIIFFLLWPYSYPVYLFRRKNFGGRNLLYPILFSLIIFIFSAGYLYYSLEMKKIDDDSMYRRKLYQRITR